MKKLFKFYLLSFILLSNFMAFAQLDEGTGIEGGDPTYAPINGQLILLIILGIAFVLHTLRKNKKIV